VQLGMGELVLCSDSGSRQGVWLSTKHRCRCSSGRRVTVHVLRLHLWTVEDTVLASWATGQRLHQSAGMQAKEQGRVLYVLKKSSW
jgi:hypothetical protein